jgi:hypothetical protein
VCCVRINTHRQYSVRHAYFLSRTGS